MGRAKKLKKEKKMIRKIFKSEMMKEYDAFSKKLKELPFTQRFRFCMGVLFFNNKKKEKDNV